ncbi:MAG: glycosyltransferase, partial [Chloroflexota bacterium]|nr:glycosyltransferase [Chloroflexota bacterium]
DSLRRCLASRDLYRELWLRPRTLLQPAAADRAVGHVASALRVAEWLERFLASRRLQLGQTICYTYWLWTETVGVGMVRHRHPEMLIVSRAHGFDLYAERWEPPYIPMQRSALESADAVFAVSAHGCDYLRTRHPVAADRVHVARLGVRDPGTVAARSEDGILRILTCSRIEEVKRLDLAIKGIAEFARQHPDLAVDWTHFGSGQLRESVRAAAERELPTSVKWSFRGETPNEEVLDHYRRSPVDLLLNVSWSEGVPVSMMEAQSFGVPVIGTAVGGVPEIVDSENGVLLSPDPAPTEIASALSVFLSNRSMVHALRDRSRARWESRYSAAPNFRRFVETIQSIGVFR